VEGRVAGRWDGVAGMTLEAPLLAAAAAARFDLPLVPAELFAGDFGAVVFAITLFLWGNGIRRKCGCLGRSYEHAKKTSSRSTVCRGDPPGLLLRPTSPGA